MAPWLAIPLHKWPSAVPQLFCWLHNNINHQKNTPNLAEASPAFLVSHWKAWCRGPSTYQGTVMMISFMYFFLTNSQEKFSMRKTSWNWIAADRGHKHETTWTTAGIQSHSWLWIARKNVYNIYSKCMWEYRMIGRIYWNSLGMNMLPVNVNATRHLLLVPLNKCQQNLYMTSDPLLFRLYCM